MPLRDRIARRARRWFGNDAATWLPASLFGGAAGGCAAAWLVWGSADLLNLAICGPFQWLALLTLYLIATAGGYSLIASAIYVARAIRYLRRPPAYLMYEAVAEEAQFPELQIVEGRPGCGLALYVPILLVGAAVSLPWYVLALRSVPVGRLVLALLLGLPGSFLMARYEAQRKRESEK